MICPTCFKDFEKNQLNECLNCDHVRGEHEDECRQECADEEDPLD